jgi:ATP synthase subunit 6
MLRIFQSILFSLLFLRFFIFSYFSFNTRFSSLKSLVINFLNSLVSSNVIQFLLISLFTFLLIVNLMGNIPLRSIPTLFYSQTFTLSLLFWIPLIICVSFTQLKAFIAHMLPYGSPVGLMLFLPLVEIFSQVIRPLTLIIRLRTNLSRGHIIMYMFSYFTLLSSTLSPFIHIVIFLLFFLELGISILQAYIFVSLISLYVNETL